jgi:hypothetical protein
VFIPVASTAQVNREDIYSDYVLFQKRQRLDKDLRDNIVAKAFTQDLDSNNEHKFESACLAISQFQFSGSVVESGFEKLFAGYNLLQYETKRAFLEAVYSVSPDNFYMNMKKVNLSEIEPKLFAMSAAYLLRHDSGTGNRNEIKIHMVEKFPGYDTIPILTELEKYVNGYGQTKKIKRPDIAKLFAHQKMLGRKLIYSFQRWNRDYPGLAIVQNKDGSFARNNEGRLLLFKQLARSASDLPYFITNGSTPQGVYSLQGTAVSRNNWIGPTPNIQMILPFEDSWSRFFHQPLAPGQDSMMLYKQLFPPSWKNYSPMMEAWNAGKIGRTEIIAHGSTIDPEYFVAKPFYPLTPTMGCLCAREQWNVTTGRLLISEQFNLYSAYIGSPGADGYLYVINIDDQQKALTREEVEEWVRNFERK